MKLQSCLLAGVGVAGSALAAALLAVAVSQPTDRVQHDEPSSTAETATPERMKQLFADHAAHCTAGQEIWDRDLCVPLLLADPVTRRVTAAAPDPNGLLSSHGGLWEGTLPETVLVSNTSVEWAGQRWAMVQLPLPADATAALSVALHESFHARQEALGLPDDGQAAAHLDDRAARTWLRLELNALARALRADEQHRPGAIASAIAFRAMRWAAIPGAQAAEVELEDHEGLAQYTGDRIAYGSAAPVRVAANLERAVEGAGEYPRSFAYATGPAYGLLLDLADPGWTRRFEPGVGMATRLSQAMGWGKITAENFSQQAELSKVHFGFAAIDAEEAEREQRRHAEHAALLARFVDGPVLMVPLRSMQFTFDPGQVRPLGKIGSVYPTATINDAWGRLQVTGGVLIHGTWDRLTVPAPFGRRGNQLRGDGWELDLAPGWNARQGDGQWTLVEDSAVTGGAG